MEYLRPFATLALAASIAGCATTNAAPNVAVVIGRGQSGAPLARILKEQGYTVRVMVRDPSRAKGLPEGVQVVSGDATQPASLLAGLKGADYVLSTIGANCVPKKDFPARGAPQDVDYRGIENLAAAAKQAGIGQFVLMSSLGAGDTDPKAMLNAMCGMVLQWKGNGEASLRASGVPYTVVRPGGLKPFPGQPAWRWPMHSAIPTRSAKPSTWLRTKICLWTPGVRPGPRPVPTDTRNSIGLAVSNGDFRRWKRWSDRTE